MELFIPVITSTIAAVAAVMSAWLTTKAKADQEKAAKDTREYREERERLDKAKWKVLLATMEGVTVLLHQAKGEKLNGNVEKALGNIDAAADELNEVQTELLAKVR